MQIANACDDRWRVKNALGLRVYPVVGVRHGHRFTAEFRNLEGKRRQHFHSRSRHSSVEFDPDSCVSVTALRTCLRTDGRTDLIYEAAFSGEDKERTKRKGKAVNYAIRSSERATGLENGSRCCPPAWPSLLPRLRHRYVCK